MTIFLPVLYLMGLLLLSRSRGKQDLVIYYDILPRYLRGVCRVLGLPSEKLAGALARLSGCRIQRIPGDEEIPRFPQIHLSSMERVTDIIWDLLPWATASPWTQTLAALIGPEPARAYIAKCLARELFPPVLSVAAGCEALNNARLTVAWDPSWPPAWYGSLKEGLQNPGVTFFVWPEWYRGWLGFWARIKILGQLPALAVSFLWSRGLVRQEVSKREIKVITEFIDPKRFQGTAYDADYWIDGQQIKTEDVLFFLTRGQARILRGDGYSQSDLARLLEQKGYQLQLLDELPYTVKTFKSLGSLYGRAVKAGLRSPEAYLGRVVVGAWRDYLEFASLFSHYHAQHFIYLTIPNGHTGLRWNDAIITGLCRQNRTKSVGCQTRAVYSRNYEYFFDCFDLYLSWGPAWRQKLPNRLEFVGQAVDVGCIYLDYLLPTLAHQRPRAALKEKILVAIFDGDISANHHYTRGYNAAFLRNCAALARLYPDCHFLIKNKEPRNAEIIMEDKEFRRLLEKVEGNLEFASRERCDYGELMAQADIVLAIAFTTPGVEGLLLGKPALYYSELQCGGQAFSGFADLMAGNFKELKQWFARVLDQVKQGYVPNGRVLDELSAFRDGGARSRIVQILEG